jgi:hypothetical protein
MVSSPRLLAPLKKKTPQLDVPATSAPISKVFRVILPNIGSGNLDQTDL